MMVGGFDGERFSTPVGTAIMVAPGLALTAEHVLREIQALGQSVEALAPSSDGSMTWWRATGFSSVALVDKKTSEERGRYDLAAMAIEPVSNLGGELRAPLVITSSEPPMIGEPVMVLGFQGDEQTPDEVTLFVSTGRVTERYLTGRDRVMLPNPCLQLELDTWGGMSGGAVVNRHGEVIGIVSSSLSAVSKVSFASLLGPVQDLYEINIPWPPNWYEPTKTTLDKALAQLDERSPPPPRRVTVDSIKVDFKGGGNTVVSSGASVEGRADRHSKPR